MGLGYGTSEGEPDFAVFEVVVHKRSRSWLWKVCLSSGEVVMTGRESSRAAAGYKSARALFLLLSAPRTGRTQIPAPRRTAQRDVVRRDAAAAPSRELRS